MFIKAEDNVSRVEINFPENGHLSQQLDIFRSSLQGITDNGLHLNSYKIQLTQKLKPTDHSQSQQFVKWFVEQYEADHHFGETTK